MELLNFFKSVIFAALFSLVFIQGFSSDLKSPNNKLSQVNLPSSFSATSSENAIVIRYNLPSKSENTYLVISDILGNKIKIIKVTDKAGKIELKRSDLEKYSGSIMFTCTLQVNGNKIFSQPVSLLN